MFQGRSKRKRNRDTREVKTETQDSIRRDIQWILNPEFTCVYFPYTLNPNTKREAEGKRLL